MSGLINSTLISECPIRNISQAKEQKNKNNNVRVVCRVKPLNIFEQPIDMTINKQNGEISIPQPRQETTKTFTFNRIFTDQSQEQFVYQVCRPVLRKAISEKQGFLIFSYGVTNSGKTHTILGSQAEPGILPYLVKKLNQTEKVYLSAIQLYNDQFFSLVNRQKLVPRQQNGFLDFQNYPISELVNQQNMDRKFKQYINNRTQNDTKLNSKSSRSHAIFRIKSGNVNIGVVDLAGSERTNRVFASIDQTSNINKSLLCLGKCIKALNQNPQCHIPIPYRQSKLTKVLIQYFAAKVQVLMIANINQSQLFYHENMKVLDYAVLAKDIRHCSTQNSLRKNQFKFPKTNKVDIFEALYKSATKSSVAHKSLKCSRSKLNEKLQKSNLDKTDANKKFARALKAQQLKIYLQKFDSSQETFDFMIQYMHQKELQSDLKNIQLIKNSVYQSPNMDFIKQQESKRTEQVGVGRSQPSEQFIKKQIYQQMRRELLQILEKQRMQKQQHKQTFIGDSLMKRQQKQLKQQSIPVTPLKKVETPTPPQQNFVMKTSSAIYSSVKKILTDKVYSLKNIIPNLKKSAIKNQKLSIHNYGAIYESLFTFQCLQDSRNSQFSFQNKKQSKTLKNKMTKQEDHRLIDSQTQTQSLEQQSTHYQKQTQQTGIETDDQTEYPSLQIYGQQTSLLVNNNQVTNCLQKQNMKINQVQQNSQDDSKQEPSKQTESKSVIPKKQKGRPVRNQIKKSKAASRVAQAREIAAKMNRADSRTPLKRRLRNYTHY